MSDCQNSIPFVVNVSEEYQSRIWERVLHSGRGCQTGAEFGLSSLCRNSITTPPEAPPPANNMVLLFLIKPSPNAATEGPTN